MQQLVVDLVQRDALVGLRGGGTVRVWSDRLKQFRIELIERCVKLLVRTEFVAWKKKVG